MTRKRFLYHLSRASYNKRWKEHYQEPGLGTRLLAFFIRLIPRVGPFRALAFRTPTPDTERLFRTSLGDPGFLQGSECASRHEEAQEGMGQGDPGGQRFESDCAECWAHPVSARFLDARVRKRALLFR